MANDIVRPSALTTERTDPVASEYMVTDNGATVAKVRIDKVVAAGRPLASKAEAEAGSDAAKAMTPLTTKQSIASEVNVSIASKSQGDLATTAVQPGDLASVATTGAYGDLSGKPTLGTAAATDASDYATAAQAVPAGGTTGQVLAKASGADNDLVWNDPGGGGGGGKFTQLPEVAYSASRAVIAGDAGVMQAFGSSLAMTATLPSLSSSNGEVYNFLNDGAADLTIEPDGSDEIEGEPALVLKTGSVAMVWPNSVGDGWRALVSTATRGDSPVVIFKGKQTNVGSLPILDLAGYREITLSGYVRPATAGPGNLVGLQVSSDNGATWDAGTGYDTFFVYGVQTGSVVKQDETGISLFRFHATSSIGNGAGHGIYFNAKVVRMNENAPTDILLDYAAFATTGNRDYGIARGGRIAAAIVNAVRLVATTGNLAEVDVTVTGIHE